MYYYIFQRNRGVTVDLRIMPCVCIQMDIKIKSIWVLGVCGKMLPLFPLSFPVSSLFFPHFFFLLFFPSALYSSFPFLLLLLSKTIKVKVIDDEEYEKNKTFYIEIGEPRLVESNDAKGQEEGEPLWSQRVSHISWAACSQHMEAQRRRGGVSSCSCASWCVTVNMQQVVYHLISPHPLLYFMCVFARLFLGVFLCSYILCHVFLWNMHAFTTSLCVCMCVCVCTCVPYRKTITVRILDREEYNKLSSFSILLETPEWRRSGKKWTGVTDNPHWECTVWGF